MVTTGKIIDIKTINKKWLLQEKNHFENIIIDKPEMESFFRPKI